MKRLTVVLALAAGSLLTLPLGSREIRAQSSAVTFNKDVLPVLQKNCQGCHRPGQAAPFSLSYGAPMTAQFVIEDHALRHSWHHLARIREAVNRQREEKAA